MNNPTRIRFYLFLAAILSLQDYGLARLDRPPWLNRLAILGCCCCHFLASAADSSCVQVASLHLDGEGLEVVVLKIGGSSLTHKADKETINKDALEWCSSAISASIDAAFKSPEALETAESCTAHGTDQRVRRKRAFVVIHGAGSFGHHTAKEYALKGRFEPPPATEDALSTRPNKESIKERSRTMQGLAETRLSVQTLNRLLVSSLIGHGVNAVGMSPCFAIPKLQAHGGGDSPENAKQAHSGLEVIVRDALQAGLVPVLHGDACLYGKRDGGILSGDVLMERLGQASWVSHAIFLTDVDGVFSNDPRKDPNASLLRHIRIDKSTFDIIDPVLNVSGSSHEHDVTGGLKTKLASAAVIAASGINVTIAKCGSVSAEQALLGGVGDDGDMTATTVYSG